MKKRKMKLVLAVSLMALPVACQAQGILGALLQGIQQGVQQGLQQRQNNNSYSAPGGFSGNPNSGLLIDQTYLAPYNGVDDSQMQIDQTYMLDENGNRIYYDATAPQTQNSGNSTSRSSSSSTRQCGRCGGGGGCPTCGGTGKQLNTMYGGRTYSTCSTCHGNKKCPRCGR